MIKRTKTTLLIFLFAANLFGQNIDSIKTEILSEGLELYKLERVAWISTDKILDESSSNQYVFNGYLSYKDSISYVSIYYYHDSFDTKIKFTAKNLIQDTINKKNTFIIKEDRIPTDYELLLIKVKENAIDLISDSPNLNKHADIINYNIALIDKGEQIYCFLLPGSFSNSVFYVGGDYILKFSKNAVFQEIEALHKTLIPMRKLKDTQVYKSYHTHLPEFSPYMTSTDICQFKLYGKLIAGCIEFIVLDVLERFVSIYNSETDNFKIVKYAEYDGFEK